MSHAKKKPSPRAGKTHLYEALSAKIEASIRKKGLPPHAPFLSHRVVEKAYGSNNITVAKAMKDLVDRGILYAVPYKGCFVSPVVRNRKILCISDGPNLTGAEYDFVNFVFAAQRHIEDTNGPFEVIPMSMDNFAKVHGDLRQRVPDLAGVVVFRNPSSLAAVTRVAGDLPVVFFGGRSRMPVLKDFPGVSRVLYDEAEVGRMACRHLVERGRKVLGVLDHPDFVVAHAMAEGFLAACGEAPSVKADGFVWNRGPDGVYDAREEEDLMAWARKHNAVFCPGDYVALAFMQVCMTHGLRIPQDLAVVSVNDAPVCRELRPPLSSVRLVPEASVKDCLDLIAEPGEPRERRVAIALQVRDSSGPSRSRG